MDALHEIRKFRPLPVSEAEVSPIGLDAGWREEMTQALNKLGMVQFRSAADLKVLVAKAQDISTGQMVEPQAEGPNEEAERLLLTSFLPIVDTFDLSYDAVILLGQPEWKLNFDQFRAIITQLLEQMGLAHLPAEGHPFDPDLHEEAGMFSHDDPAYAHLEPGTIATVYQRGFTWKGKLLRRAQVIVVR